MIEIQPPTNAVTKGVFLRAEWRYLAMVNFAIDPSILRSFVPKAIELDSHDGTTYVSLVGFRFLKTSVFGLALPFHRDFDEVNLRFYVRRKGREGWRRGVVFIREMVPRALIAFVARTVYGEPYLAVPMRHVIEQTDKGMKAQYLWKRQGGWESLSVSAHGQPQSLSPGSETEFITEHFWGYTANSHGCSEYQVEHPSWKVWRGVDARFEADIASLYGRQFVEVLSAEPTSAFIAEGSEVLVRRKTVIRC